MKIENRGKLEEVLSQAEEFSVKKGQHKNLKVGLLGGRSFVVQDNNGKACSYSMSDLISAVKSQSGAVNPDLMDGDVNKNLRARVKRLDQDTRTECSGTWKSAMRSIRNTMGEVFSFLTLKEYRKCFVEPTKVVQNIIWGANAVYSGQTVDDKPHGQGKKNIPRWGGLQGSFC